MEININSIRVLAMRILVFLGFCYVSFANKVNVDTEKKTYIVHMAKSEMPASFADITRWYESSLKAVDESAEIMYTYNNVIHGFSARLNEQHARELENRHGILSVLEEVKYELHTTRTPSFLGLDQNAALLPSSNAVSEVIVGVLDTGVWPESKSFDDAGFPPVPSSWKGECEIGTNFTKSNCNRKLIGARYFTKGYEAIHGRIDESKEPRSARDTEGHGTHTASTAAGSVVLGANLLGYAVGTAHGMATRARLSVYKVCWKNGCLTSDILAAMDQAIDDNVNVMSISIGAIAIDYYLDSISIGAFSAMEKGILVSCSAGNSGPDSFSLSNIAPWITTVGAGTIDRDFPAYVILGNGKKYYGVSLYSGKPLPRKLLPLVYAGSASNVTNGNLCLINTLDPEKVRGKIVLCDRGINTRVEKGSFVKAAGGAGMIVANMVGDGEELLADAHLLPATMVGQKNGEAIKKYLSSNPNPTATIVFEGTKLGIEPSPMVAAFSSRGPNPVTLGVLKPDMIAPGINILAGWTGELGPTSLPLDDRRVEFNIISGTSMSCPHVSGLAALLKAAHPDWSPAAIRSALMTTAYTNKNGKPLQDLATSKPSTPFDHGAGHVNPIPALNPGLVYDLTVEDYLNFLCALNYTTKQISSLTKRKFGCDSKRIYSLNDLNYPSFSVVFQGVMHSSTLGSGHGKRSSVVKHSRTLTNVGSAATYKVSTFTTNDAIKILVEPDVLTFSRPKEKRSYTVTFTATSMPSDPIVFGRIEWSSGKYFVTSTVAINWT